jgi:hypothetical protein
MALLMFKNKIISIIYRFGTGIASRDGKFLFNGPFRDD